MLSDISTFHVWGRIRVCWSGLSPYKLPYVCLTCKGLLLSCFRVDQWRHLRSHSICHLWRTIADTSGGAASVKGKLTIVGAWVCHVSLGQSPDIYHLPNLENQSLSEACFLAKEGKCLYFPTRLGSRWAQFSLWKLSGLLDGHTTQGFCFTFPTIVSSVTPQSELLRPTSRHLLLRQHPPAATAAALPGPQRLLSEEIALALPLWLPTASISCCFCGD